jgi:hypothetical protein
MRGSRVDGVTWQGDRMRILVITLATIENEFEECVASIARQTYRNFHHLVLRDLPSMEANRALYGTFLQRADEFDLLIRVDADMVIENDHLFEWVVEQMCARPSLQMVSIDVHDFFVDGLISGLHTYRNTVQFPLDDPIQPDHVRVPRGRVWIERSRLGYGIRHCKNPSTLQSLHHGIHRGVKMREWIRRGGVRRIHWYAWMIQRIWTNFAVRGDRRLALALLGAQLGLRGVFAVEHLDHHTELPKRVLQATEQLDDAALEGILRKLKREAWGVLPAWLRTWALKLGGVRPLGRDDVASILVPDPGPQAS